MSPARRTYRVPASAPVRCQGFYAGAPRSFRLNVLVLRYGLLFFRRPLRYPNWNPMAPRNISATSVDFRSLPLKPAGFNFI